MVKREAHQLSRLSSSSQGKWQYLPQEANSYANLEHASFLQRPLSQLWYEPKMQGCFPGHWTELILKIIIKCHRLEWPWPQSMWLVCASVPPAAKWKKSYLTWRCWGPNTILCLWVCVGKRKVLHWSKAVRSRSLSPSALTSLSEQKG